MYFLLSDNIRKYRKSKQMSQDELAEKLAVTRQSISLWETGQTQPSLDNIVALAKLFDISTDALLTDTEPENIVQNVTVSTSPKNSKIGKTVIIAIICFIVAALIVSMVLFKDSIFGASDKTSETFSSNNNEKVFNSQNTYKTNESDIAELVIQETSTEKDNVQDNSQVETKEILTETQQTNSPAVEEKVEPVVQEKIEPVVQEKAEPVVQEKVEPVVQEKAEPVVQEKVEPVVQEKAEPVVQEKVEPVVQEKAEPVVQEKAEPVVQEKAEPVVQEKATENAPKDDLYGYLKDFVIQNGTLNGDYCYYTKTANNYGGYPSEDFSLYYWGDTDTIEFCLHSVIDETFSINFYLYVPKRHTGKYEYISSYYFRDSGEPLYEAKGVITAKEFTKNYPLKCDRYTGSEDIRNEFMEMSRQGICDLIECLEGFIAVEGLEYSFLDFGFTKF